MFGITIETQFKASHSVSLSDGTVEPEHEHFWAVSAEVAADKLDSRGMAVDFAVLKSRVDSVTSKLGGALLNDVDYFRQRGPTAENVAAYVFEELKSNLPGDVRLKGVTVSEQVGCSARYTEDTGHKT